MLGSISKAAEDRLFVAFWKTDFRSIVCPLGSAEAEIDCMSGLVVAVRWANGSSLADERTEASSSSVLAVLKVEIDNVRARIT